MKAISAQIFKPSYGDCSNGGISSKYDEVLIEHPQGWIEVDESDPPENLCIVIKRFLFGRNYYHIEPIRPRDRGSAGYMYGGTIVYSSDSRFRELTDREFGCGALPLHDRQETQELYDMLSH